MKERPEIEAHEETTAKLAKLIAEEMKLNDEEVALVEKAASIHEMGRRHKTMSMQKEDFLMSPVTEKVFRQTVGLARLDLIAADEDIALINAIYYQYERWDGKGYPDGLKGKNTPIAARIIMVASDFDMMTAGRFGQTAVQPIKAVSEMAQSANSKYDPDVIRALRTIISEGRISNV